MPKVSVAGTPADKTVKYTTLTIDGETYSLLYDFNAIATAEAIAKVNLLEAINLRNLTAQQFRGLLYAALIKAQPRMTLTDAGELISLKNMPTITDAVLEAWTASISPASAEDTTENPQ